MRTCKCGAALDYASDDVRACWACRDRVMAKAVDVQIQRTQELINNCGFVAGGGGGGGGTMPGHISKVSVTAHTTVKEWGVCELSGVYWVGKSGQVVGSAVDARRFASRAEAETWIANNLYTGAAAAVRELP